MTSTPVNHDQDRESVPHGGPLSNGSRYELLVQSVVDYAIYLLDASGRIVSWNAGAQRIKGYTAEEVIGKHFSMFYTPEDQAAETPLHNLALAASEGHFQGEACRVRKDGTRFHAMVAMDAVRDEQGRLIGFAKVTRDITERVEMEMALEQARQQLFQSQKLDALGQLTGGIASDFNSLLHALAGGLEIARMQVARDDTSQLEKRLAEALNLVQRAAQLTQHLMAFARRQPLAPRQFDLNEWLGDVRELLLRTVGAQVRIEFDLDQLPLPLHCDPHQLENALLNLVLNSCDAMPDGGSLRIATSRVQREDGMAGEWVRLAVKDTGVGMSSEMVGRVFEPFFTTKPLGQGAGLGLSIVHGFVRQSNGHIALHSKVGEGTEVEIWLPIAEVAERDASRDADRHSDPMRAC